MIVYDQLRISDDGMSIYIDAHVNKADCFASTVIEQLCICLGSQVYETQTIDPESNVCIYTKNYGENIKEIHEVITLDAEGMVYAKDSFSKDLFFIYVKCSGQPEACSCFASIGSYVLGVTFDENLYYQHVMGYTKQMADECKTPVGFTDFILLWNAFKAAVETEHYLPAIKFYNMLFGKDVEGNAYGPYGNANGVISKPCGCHG